MKKLLLIAALLANTLMGFVYGGWAVTVIWSWLIAPHVAVKALPFSVAVGGLVLVRLAVGESRNTDIDHDLPYSEQVDTFVQEVMRPYLRVTLMLGVACVFSYAGVL